MPPKTKPKAIGGKQGETDDSICDVVAPNVVPAREGFLAFTVSKSANVAIPASVAVTPEKPHPPSGASSDTRAYFTIQKSSFEFCKHETKEIAIDFLEKIKMFDPSVSDKLILKDFENEAELAAFIEKIKSMKTPPGSMHPKPLANPMATIPSIVNKPSKRDVTHSEKAIKEGPIIVNPYSKASAVVKRPKLGFSNEKSLSGKDEQLRRFEDAMRNSNTKLDVFHMLLPGSHFDVWGLSLKENDEHYWSWKPLALEKAIMTELANPIFDKDGTTMDEMLCHVRAANLREVPCGPNVPQSFMLKSGKKMDKMVLFGLIASPSDEMQVKEIAVKFCGQCRNRRIQAAYSLAMNNMMKADSIKKDVGEGGQLWEKLASAAGNICYHKVDSLNQVFCDHTIEEIIVLTFGYNGGESPSMWDRRHFNLAFGESRSDN